MAKNYQRRQFQPKISATDWAMAINCWPSNIEADSIVSANQRPESGDTRSNIRPTQRFNAYAPQHVFGSQEVTYRAHINGVGVGSLEFFHINCISYSYATFNLFFF